VLLAGRKKKKDNMRANMVEERLQVLGGPCNFVISSKIHDEMTMP